MLGGGHEQGLRSGTLNVPAIVGFGVAAAIARCEMAQVERHVAALRNLLLELLRATAGEMIVNGSLDLCSVPGEGLDEAKSLHRNLHPELLPREPYCA